MQFYVVGQKLSCITLQKRMSPSQIHMRIMDVANAAQCHWTIKKKAVPSKEHTEKIYPTLGYAKHSAFHINLALNSDKYILIKLVYLLLFSSPFSNCNHFPMGAQVQRDLNLFNLCQVKMLMNGS